MQKIARQTVHSSLPVWESPWPSVPRWTPPTTELMGFEQFSQPLIQSNSLKLLNWNIAKNNHLAPWQSDFAQIIHYHQPDILFFQELRLVDPMRCPLALEGIGWHFAPNFVNAQDQHHFGVLTASKIQHIAQRVLLTEHAEPLFKTPKAALLTEYALAGQTHTLIAVNVHGLNFVRTYKFQSQLNQIKNQLIHHPGPIILSGDFNTWSVRRMKHLRQLTTQLGLKTVSFSDVHQKQLKRFLLSDPLDHIFYRGLTLQPNSAKVLGDINSSDHKPMVVELML